MNAVLKPQFADLLGNGQTLKQFRDDILERTANTGQRPLHNPPEAQQTMFQ